MAEHKIFISYSHDADRRWIERLFRSLENEGLEPWLDYWKIGPGESWQEHLDQALRTSEAILVLISRGSENRANVWFELGLAKGMKKRSILVVPPDYDAGWIPAALRGEATVIQQSPEQTAREVAVLLQPKHESDSGEEARGGT